MQDPNKQYLLLVDDDEQYLDSTEDLLMLNGYTHILTETNPLKALELVKEYNIKVIISDYRMPPIDGVVFLKEVEKLNVERHIHKIICTGYSELEGDMDSMIREGVINDFIFKSPNIDMYLLIVKQSWEQTAVPV